jgi:hypothetical protein
MLSYAKHGRSRANAQGRTFFRLFAAATRPGRRIKAYGFGLCGSVFRNVLQGQVDHGLCASAMPEWFAARLVAQIEPTGPARGGRPDDKLREIRSDGASLSLVPGFRSAQPKSTWSYMLLPVTKRMAVRIARVAAVSALETKLRSTPS